MLYMPVQEDLNNYKEKIVGGLSKRGFFSVLGAIGTTIVVSLWLWLVFGVNPSDFGFVLMAVAVPFWCFGFLKPSGMYFEEYLPKWIEKNFKKRYLVHECYASKQGIRSDSMRKEIAISFDPRKFRGIEAYSPCEVKE